MARKSWSEKFASDKPCEVKAAPKDFADIKAGQQMLLTTPSDVAAFIERVPEGQQIDMAALRSGLAQRHGADIACPVVTGIHLRTVAEMVGEQLDAGMPPKKLVPAWRIVGPKSPTWKKLENGKSHFEALRRAEGLET